MSIILDVALHWFDPIFIIFKIPFIMQIKYNIQGDPIYQATLVIPLMAQMWRYMNDIVY